jgi:hypothetical protein
MVCKILDLGFKSLSLVLMLWLGLAYCLSLISGVSYTDADTIKAVAEEKLQGVVELQTEMGRVMQQNSNDAANNRRPLNLQKALHLLRALRTGKKLLLGVWRKL